MSRSHVRAVWIGFFAVLGGSTLAALVGVIVDGITAAALALLWLLGAGLTAAVAWNDAVDTADLRFTADGWTLLAWVGVFLLPPLGIVLGLILHVRGNAQGMPMVQVSLAVIALYALLAKLV